MRFENKRIESSENDCEKINDTFLLQVNCVFCLRTQIIKTDDGSCILSDLKERFWQKNLFSYYANVCENDLKKKFAFDDDYLITNHLIGSIFNGVVI